MSAKKKRTHERKQKLNERGAQQIIRTTSNNNIETSFEKTSLESSSSGSEKFVPNEKLALTQNLQNRLCYPKHAATSDRYRVSSRATAAIVNSALQDIFR